MARIGFLGLGRMGHGMAHRLLAAGHSLSVYNRTPEKATSLEAAGAVIASTPRAAADGADVVFAMVADDIASRQVWLGEQGALSAALAPGAVAIECSTLSYDWARELGGAVQKAGVSYLDCPVTGMPDAAAAGTLTLFIGGDGQVIQRIQPVLAQLSERQIHFGGIGAGTSYKLIVNLMGSIQIAATAEAMAVAEKAGLDLSQVSEALSTGAAASANVVRCSGQMVRQRYADEVPFSADLRLKDTRYGVALAKQFGQAVPLGEVAESAFLKTVEAGFGRQSESKVADLVQE